MRTRLKQDDAIAHDGAFDVLRRASIALHRLGDVGDSSNHRFAREGVPHDRRRGVVHHAFFRRLGGDAVVETSAGEIFQVFTVRVASRDDGTAGWRKVPAELTRKRTKRDLTRCLAHRKSERTTSVVTDQSFPETDANLTKDFIRVAGDRVGGVHHEGEFGVHEFHEKHGDVEILVVDAAGFTRQPRTLCPF